jgi:cation-transporting P-type ATPase I
MLTGDQPSTAEGIAAQLGLLDGDVGGRRVGNGGGRRVGNGSVVTGAELDEMQDDELAERIERFSVFARLTPLHKTRIVAALQRAGHPVAMTGDGANDAPSIRLADVGVAFGPHSTPAARAAATRPPAPELSDRLFEEGPEASLGAALDRAIAARVTATTGGAAMAWGLAHSVGARRRASTVALVRPVSERVADLLAAVRGAETGDSGAMVEVERPAPA